MTVLVLRFKGPLQSWGQDSRHQERRTHHAPTKSAVVGLLAAAEGRRRSDAVEDLAELEFGVRVDQPGTVLRDYQTAIDWRSGPPARLSNRYYLEDACFLVAIGGPDTLIKSLEASLRNPAFPLFLGRRTCPANHDLVVGVMEGGDVESVLRSVEWQASEWHRRTRPTRVSLPLYRDARPGEAVEEQLRDVPLSFDPQRRDYAWRAVHMPPPVEFENSSGRNSRDPFWEAVVGA
ncbi:type I-E CRISPR-associated protein Cas5/CasD [Micrococcus sp.]|uniref:type I-E CRISPR-associated protein Cas5/CasD n=1 Tax=Micrococcus sp. TaxID=1271 RepID=UPI002A91428A|nr:type I-E CRISPR-associated protein Cas5/CasD [Micrococcus sp.]MDY6054509.1 type I-E CRISPR-associated protein Cas5/CasD [Micrococcus sp.]